ncbi:MAG: hypothetical protein E7473_05275 [Ruminococcaceae bacterium]|nr:hypothetical protein [Oscillospiraceae bacterium]
MKKRIIAAILSISMIVSFIPVTFAAENTPADVIYDFSKLTSVAAGSLDTLGFEINNSGAYGQWMANWKTGVDISGKQVGLRVNTNADWEVRDARSNKAAMNIKVTESGWYSPSFTGGLTSQGLKISIYLLTGDAASARYYLGDYDLTYSGTETTSNQKCVVGSEKKLNAVYLTEGTHTVVFCIRAAAAGASNFYPYFVNFKLHGLSEKPSFTDVETEIPELCKGDSAGSSVRAKMTDGSFFGMPDWSVKGNMLKAEDLTGKNYIAISSENPDIAAVTDVKRAGVGYSEKYTYVVTGTGVGTTNLLFTPYVDGIAQETYKKEIMVLAPPKLEKISLAAKDSELANGRETIAEITELIRDDGGIYTGDYEIEFTSSNADVIEVAKTDEKSCKIISKNIGKAKVIATATAEGLAEPVVATVDITVYERPILTSIELTADKTILNIGDKGNISVKELLMSDGLPAFSATDYELLWENDNCEVLSFNAENGEITALALGNAEIRASALNENGKRIYGKLLVSVVEKSDAPVSDKSIVVDFGETVTEKIDGKWTTVKTPGYEIVTSKSNMGTWICGQCPDGVNRLRINAGATNPSQCWPLRTSPNSSVTFNVSIPDAGYYAVFFTGGKHNRGAVYSSYLDSSIYLGDYDFRGPNAVDKADGGERKQFNTVYLAAGTHEITFKGRTHYSNPYVSLEKLELIPIDITEIAPSDIVTEKSVSLAVGEKLFNLEAYVKMTDNSPYSFGYTANGEVDSGNSFTAMASNDNITVSYDSEYKAGDTELQKFDIRGQSVGESELVLKSFVNNSAEVEKRVPVTVTDEKLDSVVLGISKKIIFNGDTATLSAVPKLDSGRVPSVAPDAIVYSSDSDVVKIEGNTLTALRSGTAKVDVSITLGAVTKTDSITVTVFDGGIADMKITAGGSRFIRLGDVVPVYITGVTTDGIELDITGKESLAYESLTPEVCDVDAEGNLIAKKSGKVILRVTEVTDQGNKSFDVELEVIAGKQDLTIYTEDERANALENAKKYTWAKSLAKTASGSAEKYADMLDVLYNGLPSEGVMRSYTVGEFNDPEKYYCRYCGKNLLPEYGDPPFVINPVSRPWKIQCPDCKRLFPSNDFGSFYELGLNEYGEFDRIRALEAHREMLIEKGLLDTSVETPGEEYSNEWYAYYGYGVEGGYLYNDAYPELRDSTKSTYNLDPVKKSETDGRRWGVDDGFGYMPGRSYYSNNTAGQQVKLCDERHNYIAYYLHYFYYRYYMPAITDSADAYLYTGKPEYGYTAAILLDRLADFYPSYDLSLYGTKIWASHGGLYNGKYMGSITESVEDATIISAYDAVYRLYDDDFVLNYIAEKNKEFKMRHAKKSPSQIRTNVEDGVLREMLESCTNGDIRGNFGFSQAVIAAAAVALDNGDETIKWLDFLIKPGFVRIGNVTGGGLYDWLITYLDSDGQPNEASLYNYNWLTYLLDVQSYLDDYTIKYDKVNLRTYPRFIKLLYAFMPPMLSSYNANYGDSSRKTLINKVWMGYDTFITGYRWTGDTDFLKALYMKYEDVTVFNEGVFVKNPENIQDEVLKVIEDEGKYNPPSETMTQFGFSVIRDGEDFRTNYGTNGQDFRRNFWMYFGYNGGHGHKDTLNLGMDAFGYNFMPDLGYPETTGTQPNRLQWISTTLSHNTIVVDEEGQVISDKRGTPLHFDDTELVKLMDVDAKEVYPQTDIYRRSVIMIKIDDQISYGIDFFRIKGGDKHEYSLHTTSDEVFEVKGLGAVEKQTDENGNYVGTLASPDYPYGEDPVSPNASSYKTFYPRGYTWLENVDRYNSPENKFEVDFAIKDFEKMLPDSKGLHMRATMLGVDSSNTKVAFADGYPARSADNKSIPSLRYMFVKREGENLDTLFTTVLEPYKNTRTLSDITELALIKKNGYEERSDKACAIKVTHTSGRVDYVFYATNNAVTYTLTDDGRTIDFRGFVGVYSVQNGENIYRYVCDGDIIGEATEQKVGIYGRVSSFTEGLELENEIVLTLSEEISEEEVAELAGRYVFIENDGVRNGAYQIKSAELKDGKLILNTGMVDYIRALVDLSDLNGGFTYNIAPRQDAYIPLSYSESKEYPYFTLSPKKLSVSADSVLKAKFEAENINGSTITYKGTVLPRGASVDSATGELIWKPSASQVGDNHIAITAYDEFGRQTTANVMVSVHGSTTGGISGGGGGGETSVPTKPSVPDKDKEETTTSPKPSTEGSGKEDEKVRFIDLGAHDWAADSINALADEGIIKGTTDNTYSPANNITRADFAILLVRAFELESDDTANFDDVADTDYFAEELAIARNTGIVNGIGDNKYAPRNTITRQDMMVIVYRAMQKLGTELKIADVDYEDFDSVADYAKEAVKALITAGLVNGKSGKIAPTDYTTRAEVAVLIKRILDYKK